MQYFVLVQIYQGVSVFLSILKYALIVYCVLSWFASPINRLYVLLSRVVDPLLAPFRMLSARLIRRGLRFDPSVIFALVALQVVEHLVGRLLSWMMYL
jgi:uncharacterized protein YggT (Ycf19 family)